MIPSGSFSVWSSVSQSKTKVAQFFCHITNNFPLCGGSEGVLWLQKRATAKQTNSPHANDVLVTRSNATPGTWYVGGVYFSFATGGFRSAVVVDCISNSFSVFDFLPLGRHLVLVTLP